MSPAVLLRSRGVPPRFTTRSGPCADWSRSDRRVCRPGIPRSIPGSDELGDAPLYHGSCRDRIAAKPPEESPAHSRLKAYHRSGSVGPGRRTGTCLFSQNQRQIPSVKRKPEARSVPPAAPIVAAIGAEASRENGHSTGRNDARRIPRRPSATAPLTPHSISSVGSTRNATARLRKWRDRPAVRAGKM